MIPESAGRRFTTSARRGRGILSRMENPQKRRLEVDSPSLMSRRRSHLKRGSGALTRPRSRRILRNSSIRLLDPMCERQMIFLIWRCRHGRRMLEKRRRPKQKQTTQMRPRPNLVSQKAKYKTNLKKAPRQLAQLAVGTQRYSRMKTPRQLDRPRLVAAANIPNIHRHLHNDSYETLLSFRAETAHQP